MEKTGSYPTATVNLWYVPDRNVTPDIEGKREGHLFQTLWKDKISFKTLKRCP